MPRPGIQPAEFLSPEGRIYAEDQMYEYYPAWELEGAPTGILCSNVAAISPEYYYSLDSMLMYMSKGGFDYVACQRTSVRVKEAYFEEFRAIYAAANKGAGSSGKEVDTSTPPVPTFS